MKKKVIFDVDTGIDDAVAIIMAVASKKFNIQFFCSSKGNTTAHNSAQNTQHILEMISAPHFNVVVGSKNAFYKNRPTRNAHGDNGLGNYKFPPHQRQLSTENFIDLYTRTLNSKQKSTIIALGPLTNIAVLIKTKPHLSKKIKAIYFMGGTLDKIEGDTPYAGFNVGCDPEAVEFLLKQKIKLIFCPNNYGRIYSITKQEVDILSRTNHTGKILAKMFTNYHDHFIKEGAPMYDSTTVFAAMHPLYTKRKKVFMELKYYEKLGTGLVIPHFDQKPNSEIIMDLNGKKMKKLVFNLIKKLS